MHHLPRAIQLIVTKFNRTEDQISQNISTKFKPISPAEREKFLKLKRYF